LNANVKNLELEALVLVVSLFAAVPALDLALWGCQPFIALSKSNTITIGLSVALVSCWHLIIVEELHYLNDGLGETVNSLCHVVCKVGLQLVVSGAVQSLQDHAQQILFTTYNFCLLDLVRISQPWLSLLDQLGCDQPVLVSTCASIGFNGAHQCFEVFHVLGGGHIISFFSRLILCVLLP
jgi:hypothetical protein